MPGDLTERPIFGPQDLEAIINLVRERPRHRLANFPSFVDLQEMLALPQDQCRVRLWERADGSVGGYGILDLFPKGGRLIFETRTGITDDRIWELALNWAVAEMRGLAQSRDRAQMLVVAVRDDPQRQSFLEASGFMPEKVFTAHLERSLDEPIRSPALPPGFRLGLAGDLADVDSWVRLHRAAHQTEDMTRAYRLAMMAADSYDPELDLVAVNPDGELAAYCVAYIDVAANELTGRLVGYTDPLATHPNYQGFGLAQRLLAENLQRLKSHGMHWAGLGSQSSNAAMLQLAWKAGFKSVASTRFFTRMVTS